MGVRGAVVAEIEMLEVDKMLNLPAKRLDEELTSKEKIVRARETDLEKATKAVMKMKDKSLERSKKAYKSAHKVTLFLGLAFPHCHVRSCDAIIPDGNAGRQPKAVSGRREEVEKVTFFLALFCFRLSCLLALTCTTTVIVSELSDKEMAKVTKQADAKKALEEVNFRFDTPPLKFPANSL